MLIAFSSSVFALTQKDFAMGLGMETRASRDVNPDYVTPQYMGMLYAKLRLKPFEALLETSRSERDSGSGSLRVHSESTLLAGWGRYEVFPEQEWIPFAALGFGTYFDTVTTRFQDSRSSNNGRRGFLGAGAGASKIFWQHFLVEVEGRVLSVEQARDPVLTGIVRLGCQM
jgi:hypothetical protein